MTNTVYPTSYGEIAAGKPVNMSDDTVVKRDPGRMIGFYVNSTSSGTIKIYDGLDANGTLMSNTITPAIGFHPYPAAFSTALFIDKTGGSIDLTVFVA